jgi:hypothetical protein
MLRVAAIMQSRKNELTGFRARGPRPRPGTALSSSLAGMTNGLHILTTDVAGAVMANLPNRRQHERIRWALGDVWRKTIVDNVQGGIETHSQQVRFGIKKFVTKSVQINGEIIHDLYTRGGFVEGAGVWARFGIIS